MKARSASPARTFLSTAGEGYELQMGRWSSRLAPLFAEFAEVSTGRVLDVGCGTGSLGACLARAPEIASVLGVDSSAAYVEWARRNNCDARLAFQVGDACALQLRDGSFDHALSMLALQFIPRADLAVREMRRATRPGGTVAAATWDTRGGFVAFRMILDAAASLGPRGNEQRARAYTRPLTRPGELAELWRRAGLTNVLQEMRTIRMDFTSFQDFWTPVEGQEGPVAEYVGSLDVRARTRLRNAVELSYLDGEADGLRSYAATAWVVRGKVPPRSD